MFNLKTDNIEQITENAIKQANGGNPMENLPLDYLQNIKKHMNNPLAESLFKKFGLNKSECSQFLDRAISQKSGATTNQSSNKYKKGLEQFK